jgi:uncharacterized protein
LVYLRDDGLPDDGDGRRRLAKEDDGAPAEVYRRYLQNGELGFQRCDGCGVAVFYPRVLCPVCGSDALRWRTSSGRGVVYATTAVYRRDAEPYNVVLVDLEEGFRMMSRVEGMPAEEVGIGLRVLFAARVEEDGPVAIFEPAPPQAGA